jgi:hypothetical protein
MGCKLGGKHIENLHVNMVLEKNILKKYKYKKTPFHLKMA